MRTQKYSNGKAISFYCVPSVLLALAACIGNKVPYMFVNLMENIRQYIHNEAGKSLVPEHISHTSQKFFVAVGFVVGEF